MTDTPSSETNTAPAAAGWMRIPSLLLNAAKTWGGEMIADLQAWWGLGFYPRIIKALLVVVAAGILALFVNDPWRGVGMASYRVWVVTPTKTDYVSNCAKRDEADGGDCAYDRVMAVENDGDSIEFRNYDSQSFLMRLFFKNASANIQNEMEQARAKNESVMVMAIGLRWPLFSLFPNITSHPETYSAGVWWWWYIWSWLPLALITTVLWLGRGAWWWAARGVWIIFRTVVLVFTPQAALPKASVLPDAKRKAMARIAAVFGR